MLVNPVVRRVLIVILAFEFSFDVFGILTIFLVPDAEMRRWLLVAVMVLSIIWIMGAIVFFVGWPPFPAAIWNHLTLVAAVIALLYGVAMLALLLGLVGFGFVTSVICIVTFLVFMFILNTVATGFIARA